MQVVQRQLGLTPAQLGEYFSSVSDDQSWETMSDIHARLSTLQAYAVFL